MRFGWQAAVVLTVDAGVVLAGLQARVVMRVHSLPQTNMRQLSVQLGSHFHCTLWTQNKSLPSDVNVNHWLLQ